MSVSLQILYRLARESAHYAHAAAESRPEDVPDIFGVLSRTIKQILSNRTAMTPPEREMARLVSDGVAAAARRPLTAETTAALKELVCEGLGAAGPTSERGQRAKQLVENLHVFTDGKSFRVPALSTS